MGETVIVAQPGPWARAFRTIGAAAFGFLMVNGVLVALVAALNVGDWHTAFLVFVIGGVSALATGVAALIWNYLTNHPAVTPLGKALATFLEALAGGIVTLVLYDVTKAAAITYAIALWRLVGSAVTAALHTYTTNRVEAAAA